MIIKIKTIEEIIPWIHKEIFMDDYGENSSEYLLFCCNNIRNDNTNNKLSLMIVCNSTGFVSNNNLLFNSLWIDENKFTFRIVKENNKIMELIYIRK